MSLTDLLHREIAQTGPMGLDRFMQLSLLHPEFGYYTTRDPLGVAGDFTTAPEISQMFGELIGLCIAQTWMDQGRPAPFTMAELGPGRGTLMADLLRATRGVPGFHDAAEIVLVEASPVLRRKQAEAVPQARFADRVTDLPRQPLFVIANEFLDALPIRQFQRAGGGWRERLLGLDDGQVRWGYGPAQPQPALLPRLDDTRDGDIVEMMPDLRDIIGPLGARIAQFGGAALFVDYGDWRSLGDTFQALRAHEAVDPLTAPGTADLTAHVDFEALAEAARTAHLRPSAMVPQGVFLERLGITARAQSLAQHLTGAALDTHVAAHRRLTHPEEMGSLFKVMGLSPMGAALPPGLE